jgi:hypothetical protein
MPRHRGNATKNTGRLAMRSRDLDSVGFDHSADGRLDTIRRV